MSDLFGDDIITITDEDGEVLTSFVQEFGTVIKNSTIHNIYFAMPMIVNDITYRKMKVDFDDISYKGYTEAPKSEEPEVTDPESPFDIDFDAMEAGAFNASKESKAIQLWANNISAANPVVVSENENNYL